MGKGFGRSVERTSERDTPRVLALHFRISTKSQAPNSRQIPMIKILNLKQDRFGHLELKFEIYLGFACLPVGREFVIWDFKKVDYYRYL